MAKWPLTAWRFVGRGNRRGTSRWWAVLTLDETLEWWEQQPAIFFTKKAATDFARKIQLYEGLRRLPRLMPVQILPEGEWHWLEMGLPYDEYPKNPNPSVFIKAWVPKEDEDG